MNDSILMILAILLAFLVISFVGVSLYNERKQGRE